MVLSKVFEKFAEGSPISVMARALMERALEPKALDALFRERAKRQYEKRLLFSSLVELMALVVCGMHRSVRGSMPCAVITGQRICCSSCLLCCRTMSRSNHLFALFLALRFSDFALRAFIF